MAAQTKKVSIMKESAARKTKGPANRSPATDHAFDVVFGFDMETDIGSFTPYYEGVEHGTPKILEILDRHDIAATFFWTGHAAENNPEMVKRVRDAGHETGCHGLSKISKIFGVPCSTPS